MTFSLQQQNADRGMLQANPPSRYISDPGKIYSCFQSGSLPPSCFAAITKLFSFQIDSEAQLALSGWTATFAVMPQ